MMQSIGYLSAIMFDLEPHEKEGFKYILGVPILIGLIMVIAFLTHILLTP